MASIVQLQYAVELARQKSFHKAAKRCFVTQPTLSMQIQKLEEEYEGKLFDRSRKPVELTQFGESLLPQFHKVLGEYDRIEQIARWTKGEVAGEYRLAVIPTMAPALLPKLIKTIKRRYPKIILQVRERTTQEIIEGLVQGDLDGAILATPLGHSAIDEQRLFYESLCVVHGKNLDLPQTKNGRVRVADLPLDRMLLLAEGNCLRTQTIDLCSLQEKSRDVLGFAIEASSLMTLLNLVQEGDYFAIVPVTATLDLSQRYRQQQLKEFAGQAPVREVGFVTHRAQIKAHLNQAVAAVAGTLFPELAGDLQKNQLLLRPLSG